MCLLDFMGGMTMMPSILLCGIKDHNGGLWFFVVVALGILSRYLPNGWINNSDGGDHSDGNNTGTVAG